MTSHQKKDGAKEPTRIRMTRVLEQYIADKVLRPATVDSYWTILQILEDDSQIRYLDEMTPERLRGWKEQVMARTSPTTWNGYRRTIRAILNYSVERGLLVENPLRMIKPSSRGNTRGRCLKEAEFQQVVRFLEQDPDPLAAFTLKIIRTFYYTGIRRSQLCGLNWGDMDLDQQTILLRKQHSKTGKVWVIPMHERLLGILRELRDDLTERLGRHQIADIICMTIRR